MTLEATPKALLTHTGIALDCVSSHAPECPTYIFTHEALLRHAVILGVLV